MKNHYLYIRKNDDGKIDVNYSDGVFSGFATTTIEGFYVYCIEKAKEWSEQLYRNYDDWSDTDRMAIADKWLGAKELPEGKYEYYFNFGTIRDIFHEEVDFLAKSMGISNYTLTVK